MAAQFAGGPGVTGMRLAVIGCSGSFAGPDSAASCYLLEAEDADGATWRILLDLGSGALGPLQRYAAAERRRAVSSSATCTPTTAWTCAATTCCASTTPAAPCRASRSGARSDVAQRMADAYDLPEVPA